MNEDDFAKLVRTHFQDWKNYIIMRHLSSELEIARDNPLQRISEVFESKNESDDNDFNSRSGNETMKPTDEEL